MREDLKQRTKRLSLAVLKLCSKLPRTREADVIGRQLIRSGTSVGANYRSACRARSKREFIAKLGIVEEEADESMYWLELLKESGISSRTGLDELLDEFSQIVAIMVSLQLLRKALRRPF